MRKVAFILFIVCFCSVLGLGAICGISAPIATLTTNSPKYSLETLELDASGSYVPGDTSGPLHDGVKLIRYDFIDDSTGWDCTEPHPTNFCDGFNDQKTTYAYSPGSYTAEIRVEAFNNLTSYTTATVKVLSTYKQAFATKNRSKQGGKR